MCNKFRLRNKYGSDPKYISLVENGIKYTGMTEIGWFSAGAVWLIGSPQVFCGLLHRNSERTVLWLSEVISDFKLLCGPPRDTVRLEPQVTKVVFWT